MHVVAQIPLDELDERSQMFAAAVAKINCGLAKKKTKIKDILTAATAKVQVTIISSKLLMDPDHIISLRWATKSNNKTNVFPH